MRRERHSDERATVKAQGSYPLWRAWRRFSGDFPGAAIAVGIAGIAGCAYLWFRAIPKLWAWGISPPGWATVAAILGIILVLLGSIVPILAIGLAIDGIVRGTAEKRDETLEIARKQEYFLEEKLAGIEHLNSVIPVVTYSRIQLDKFYSLVVDHARRSFRYALLAMWLGFLIIIASLINTLGIYRFGAAGSTAISVNIISTAAGVVVELVSAMFLFMYRNSLNQFARFYEEQLHLHRIVLSFGVASRMSDKKDDAMLIIVEKFLSRIAPSPPEPEISTRSKDEKVGATR